MIMLCGLPTSGKSTYVQKLKTLNQWKDAVVLSTDAYIDKEAKSQGSTYNEVFEDTIKEATKDLEQNLKNAILHQKNIIWDQTNLTLKTRVRKLKSIPEFYTCDAIYFLISLDEAFKRNHLRPGKFIPESVLKTMHSQFQIPTLEEGFNYVENHEKTETETFY
jgi:hypothetical protein